MNGIGGGWNTSGARARQAEVRRVLDYVLTAHHEQTGKLIAALAPAGRLRLEADARFRKGQLIEHVR
jgi:hypothetical protein